MEHDVKLVTVNVAYWYAMQCKTDKLVLPIGTEHDVKLVTVNVAYWYAM